MNNQQTLFSVRVSKGDFLAKAKEAYEDYSELSEQYHKEYKIHFDDRDLRIIYTGHYLNASELSERVKTIISMVSHSSDEFVTVTEDIYKLIYKYAS